MMNNNNTEYKNDSFPASFWHLEKNSAVCDLCPHHCRLEPGISGLCNVRMFNSESELVSLNYGRFSSVGVDPVEKKPLFHWKPGTLIFSVGSIGCNMRCPFCQNWQIATCHDNVRTRFFSPEELVHTVISENIRSVAFTYNEPFVSYEYIANTAPRLKDKGIDVVLVTNGMICAEPLKGLLPFIDAVNIDLKAFSAEKYRFLGGHLDTVCQTIQTTIEKGIHTEITHLVVTGFNDIKHEFEEMIEWICSISEVVPFHISRYFPAHNWHEGSTSTRLMEDFYRIANKKLLYVYKGNMQGNVTTYCRNCGKKLLEREGFRTTINNLDKKGLCSFCNTDNGIVV